MKRIVLALFGVVAVGVGAFVLGAVVSQPAAGGGKKVLYYVDPMHPSYKSDKPGIAPDCGMQLEPVYEDGQGPSGGMSALPAGSVQLAAGVQQQLGVKLGQVGRGRAEEVVRLVGRVVPDETRVYSLNASLEGNLREVAPVTTGSFVKRNQWLATFFALEARAPINAFLSSLDVLEKARERAEAGAPEIVNAQAIPSLNLERMRNVGISDLQIEEIRRTREVPTTVRILSPIDGFVLSRNAFRNQKFDKGAEWFRIADLRRVWVLADVYERDVGDVKAGASLEVVLPGSGQRLMARVSDVLPQFDAASRTFKVRLEVDNPDFALRPDMLVDVLLPLQLPEATLIPADALVDSGLKQTVFVQQKEGTFVPRSVKVGRRLAGQVEVLSGLSAGETLVVSGTFLVDSESRMKAAAAGVYGASSKDPVCGMDVDEARAKAAGKTAHAHDATWYFCSEACQQRFQAAPDGFVQRALKKQDAAAHAHPH